MHFSCRNVVLGESPNCQEGREPFCFPAASSLWPSAGVRKGSKVGRAARWIRTKCPRLVIISKGRFERPLGLAVFSFESKNLTEFLDCYQKKPSNLPNPLWFISVSFSFMLVTCSTSHCLKLYSCFAHPPAVLVYNIFPNTEDSIR